MKSASFGSQNFLLSDWQASILLYLLLVQKLHFGKTKKTTVIFKVWLAIQLISLVIPPYGEIDSPWGHANAGFLWISLHIAVRLDSLFIDILAAPLAFYTILALMTLLFYWTAALSIKYAKGLSEEEFLASVINKSPANLGFAVKLNLALIAMFCHLLIVPLVAGVFKFSTAFPALGDLAVPAILGLLVVSLLPIHLAGALLMTPINWRASFQAIAYPQYGLFQIVFVYIAAGVSVLVPLTFSTIYHPALLMIVGGSQCLFIVALLPYSQFIVNFGNFMQGYLFFSGGVVLLMYYQLVDDSDSNSIYFAPLLYFLTLPPMVLVLRNVLNQKRLKLENVRFINSISDFEFSLRSYLELDVDNIRERSLIKKRIDSVAIDDASKHGLVAIWMTHFSLLTEDVMMTKFYMSILRSHSISGFMYVHKRLLIKEASVVIDNMPQYAEIHKFIEFYQSIRVILDKDYRACIATYDFFSELIGLMPKHESLARKAKIMTESLTEAKRLYRKLLMKNKNNFELLNYYAGFIEITESSDKANGLIVQARKELLHQERKFNSLMTIVNFMDPKSSSFIISLEASDFGTVLWQKNCNGLGLRESEVLELKFEYLLPRLFDDLVGPRIERIKKYNFGKSKKTYGIKSGKTQAVLAKLELVNHADGHLAALLGLRALPDVVYGIGLVVGDRLIYAVSSIQTESLVSFVCSEFNLSSEELAKVDLGKMLKIDLNQIECEVLTKKMIGGDHHLVYRRCKGFLDERTNYLVLEGTPIQANRWISVSNEIQSQTIEFSDCPALEKAVTLVRTVDTAKQTISFASKEDDNNEIRTSQLKMSSESGSSGITVIIERSSLLLHKQSKKGKNLLRLSFILSIITFVVCSIILNIVTSDVNSELSKSVEFLDNLGLMRFNSASMAYHSKSLNLIGMGKDIISNETAIRATMNGGLTLLKAAVQNYRNELSTTNLISKDHHINELPWWDFNNEYYLVHSNLYDILSQHVRAAEIILATESKLINSSMREFQIIQRNFPVEILTYLNITVESIVIDSQDRVDSSKNLYGYLIALSCSSFVLCFLIMFLPPFIKGLSTSKRIWKVYEALPQQNVISIMSGISQRVSDLHGEEVVVDDRRSSKTLRQIKVSFTPYHIGLFVVTLFIWSSLALFAVMIVNFGSTEIFDVLKVKPNYIHFGGLQRGCNAKTLYFMREIAFPGDYWGDNGHYANAYEGFIESVECARFSADKCLALYDGRYENMTFLVLEDSRTQTLRSSNLGRGLYVALKDLVEVDYAIANSLKAGETWASLYGGFFPTYSQIIAGVSNSLVTYANATNSQLDDASDNLEMFTVAFCIYLVVFFAAFVDYFIRKIYDQIVSEIRLLKPLSCIKNPEYWATNLQNLNLK